MTVGSLSAWFRFMLSEIIYLELWYFQSDVVVPFLDFLPFVY
jgi:hypothetical protein